MTQTLEQLSAEYRSTMDCEVLHAWAHDVVAAIDHLRTGQLVAVTDDVKAALVRSRDTAMHHTLAARIPECGTFGEIAQDLDFALAEIKGSACRTMPTAQS